MWWELDKKNNETERFNSKKMRWSFYIPIAGDLDYPIITREPEIQTIPLTLGAILS